MGEGVATPAIGMQPMAGFRMEDIAEVTAEDFVHAAEVLERNASAGTALTCGCEKCKRVTHILRTMATAYKAQEDFIKSMQASQNQAQRGVRA